MIKKNVYMILTNGFDPDVRVLKEAEYLISNGFEVEIICWDRKLEYLDKQYEEFNKIKIHRIPIFSNYGTGMKQLFPYLKFIFKVRNFLKKKSYFYLHCHDFDGVIAGLFTKNKKNKKIIFDMHEIYTNYGYAKNKLFKFIFNGVLEKVNYIVYVNDEQIKNYKVYSNKMIYLPNYPRQIDYLPIKKNRKKIFKINYVGNLRDYDSLKCLASVKDKKYKIGIYGYGVCYQRLYDEFSSTIYFYGKYNGIKDSVNIYQNTDILYCVYNPNVENWKNAYPVKLYEAIVTYTPIIVSANTKVANFVDKNKIGVSIKYNNSKDLVNGIEKIIENYNQYVLNIQKIANLYKWEQVVLNLLKIYKDGDEKND